MHLPDTLTRIEDWLWNNAPATARELAPPATDADLEALRRTLGVALPDDLVTMLRWHNGGGDGDGRMTVAPGYAMLDTRGMAAITEMNRRVGSTAPPSPWPAAWLVAASSFTSSYLVVDTADPAGAVFTFDWQDRAPAPEPTWPSLADTLATMLHTIETGVTPDGFPVEITPDGHLEW
ncbi:SMI1/KNR4 family protein [Dactylosporangium sp. CA-052675]|uniref:SMI1/KNR4 family protein n=1 Tax=Dactylosporangium sp. CA-052675 TaxID=3239927 RepID=UPI003D94614F